MLQQLKNKFREVRDSNNLKKLPVVQMVLDNLISSSDIEPLDQIFNNKTYIDKWNAISNELESLQLPENTGGVNIGDQRALVNLIWHFKPKRILEIGTHIGCSTVHIAIALREVGINADTAIIDTVDIRDVNDPIEKPWMEYNSGESPANNIKKLGLDGIVNFITQPSVDFLSTSKERYDFIFLDGSHEAEMVYKELPLALKLLNKNGVILLHDYFPDKKPLWNNNVVIFGPYLACSRFKNESNNFYVNALGQLPWPTKVNSNITSLALFTK